jgi:UDP-GlcNAc:undecaprenyl-phosphate/decaprenyl-phosphate GlcNAc-1-phosphate transferase
MSNATGLVGEDAVALWVAFVAAVLVSSAGALGVRVWTRRVGIVDRPDPLVPTHTRPVATLGGIAVAAGCVAGALVVDLGGAIGLEVAVGGLLFLAVGVVDDVLKLGVLAKLLLQCVAAGVVIALGAAMDISGSSLVDAAAAFVWIIVIVNAVNLTDICDGLVSGLAAIAFLTLAAIDPSRAEPSIVAAGACGGFLVLNAPKASIFLGDAGSHLVGFLLAALSLQTVGGRDAMAELSAVVLTLGVFLFELAFLVSARRRRGLAWWLGSDDHVALRLQGAGLSVWNTDLVLWVCGAMLGIAAILVHRLDGLELVPLGLAIAAFVVVAWRVLAGMLPPTEVEGAATARAGPVG